MFGFLLRLARQALEGALSGIMAQKMTVLDQVINPAKAIIGVVQGGDVWRGNGADKFVEDVSTMIMPGLQKSHDHIERTHRNISHARDVMNTGENMVESTVSGLVDTFKFY